MLHCKRGCFHGANISFNTTCNVWNSFFLHIPVVVRILLLEINIKKFTILSHIAMLVKLKPHFPHELMCYTVF